MKTLVKRGLKKGKNTPFCDAVVLAFHLQSMCAGEGAKGGQHPEMVVEEKGLHLYAPTALAFEGSARVEVAAQQEIFRIIGLDEIGVERYILIEISPWRLVQAKERSNHELIRHFKC